MNYTFASQRQLSFVVSVGGRNLLVAFGSRNMAGVAAYMTTDEKVAQAIRRHSLSRRGIIQETTKRDEVNAEAKPQRTGQVTKPAGEAAGAVTGKTAADATGTVPVTTAAEPQEREYDNYTVARESICKELGIKKSDVRNPSALSKVAQEHGIIIKYKEI